MKVWAVAGIGVLILVAMPIVVAFCAMGWIWRGATAGFNRIKYRYLSPDAPRQTPP